ncbi:MAG: helix-turn-helix domain-containing protein [bacterium]|nr:helix-turn-helix domain-containing protein [bacterium]
MEIQEKAVYTTAEVAQILKLSPVTIERKIRRGEIPASKIGREYRLLGRDILSLFGWERLKDNMWKRKFKDLLNELRSQGEKKGITEEDISEAIKEVRREELVRAKSST